MAKRKYCYEYALGKYREPTEQELTAALATGARIKRLLKEITELNKQLKIETEKTKNCKHFVFFDEAGFPYDFRHCCTCGNVDLI